jgi:hypothetical protein
MSEEAAATGARGRPLIAPFSQGMENRPEAPSSIGQDVFVAAGAVLASFEHPFGDEAVESVGQYCARDVATVPSMRSSVAGRKPTSGNKSAVASSTFEPYDWVKVSRSGS